jgi:multidrug resistance efflux pump
MFGSFFPAWMLCAVAGIASAVILRRFLLLFGINQYLIATLTTRRMELRSRTDDAYLQADLVHMAPEVSGRIVELAVRDNQTVHRGEVLFKVDPEPFRLRVEQAQAPRRARPRRRDAGLFFQSP